MRFLNKLKIDFIGKRFVYFASTTLMLVAAAMVFVKQKGPILSIEFTGGSMIQIGFKQLPPIEDIRKSLDKNGWEGFTVQTQPSDSSVIIQVKSGEKSKVDIANSLINSLKIDFAGNVKEIPERIEFIGSVIGKEILVKTFWALLLSGLIMIVYVAFRFNNWIWGFSAVFALAHDVFITWALLTYLKAETTLVVVAALLTLAGYSINDTIVIFDRVRENLRLSRKESILDLYNRSINETMSRTLNTSMTVFLASLSLLFWGGQVIKDFAIAFSFGVIIGTYSSVGVALSMVYTIEKWRKRH